MTSSGWCILPAGGRPRWISESCEVHKKVNLNGRSVKGKGHPDKRMLAL